MRRHLNSRTPGTLTNCCIILLCAIGGGVVARHSHAETEADYQARIEANQKKIQHLESEVTSAQAQREKLLANLGNADDKIAGRDTRIQQLQQDIVKFNRRVDGLENSLRESQALISTTRQSLGKLMRTSLQVRSNDGLQVMLQHTDPALSSRLGIYYDYFFKATSARIAQETTLLETGKNAHHEALKSRNWLKYIEKKAKQQKEDLLGTKSRQQQKLNELETSVNNKEQQVQNLRIDQQKLSALLEELRRNGLGASGYFEHSKGKYPWPVKGQREAGFGEPKSVGKLTWQGLFIGADAGLAVRAIADGEAVYADWLQGFGMLVVLDHGDGFMTLYGGNREISISTGDWVEHGARIATVGDSGGLNRHGVYFEIRHNARPVDPELWVDSKNRFAKNG